MSEAKRQREHYAPVWGIFLLFLGVVFLLQSLSVLSWSLWGTLWRFWPVLIIITGLGVLLRHYNVWLVSVLILALLFTCLGIAIWQYGSSPLIGQAAKSYSEPLGDLEQAQIEIDFTAGSLTVSSLPSDSLNFVEVDSRVKNTSGGIRVDFHRQDNEGRFYLSKEQINQLFWDKGGDIWQVRFGGEIPLTVDVKSAASNIVLDLSRLQVAELRIDMDAGNCEVEMPSSAGTTYAYIEVDAANLEVTIPDGVAARVRADVNLGSLEVNESRFPRKGDYYVSRNFENAENRAELEIDCDLGRVRLR